MPKNSVLIACLSLLYFAFPASAQYDGNSQFKPVTVDGIPHIVAESDWNVNARGDHRAVISVGENAGESTMKAVRVLLPWRRPDPAPEKKRMVVVDAATGKEVRNVYVEQVTAETGQLAFQPATVPGNYEVYYLPYIYRENSGDARYGKPWNDYLPAAYKADNSWLARVKANFRELPQAKVLRFEARHPFDFFTAMGLIATREEENSISKDASGSFMIFPEDRAFPIRLTGRLPVRWVQRKHEMTFTGNALRNEYYTFQLGIFAHKQALQHVKVAFTDLSCTQGQERIPKDSLTCFNQEGVNWNGKPVQFNVAVPKGTVRALWLGVAVPATILPGTYEGWATVTAENTAAQKVKVKIIVGSGELADRGDGDLWRHSRLRWLNSTLGISNEVIAPFVPLERNGNTINAGNKVLVLDSYGLPAQVSSHDVTLFSSAVSLTAQTSQGNIQLAPSPLQFGNTAGMGKITWTTDWTSSQLTVSCRGDMAFDGTVIYTFSFKTASGLSLKNISLQLHFSEKSVPYLMGIGLEGGNMPSLPYTWNWKGPWDSFWTGGTEAGIHLEFQKGDYNGPLLNDYKPAPPAAWANKGKGTVTVQQAGPGQVMLTAGTGALTLTAGKPLEMGFKLLITPVKELNTKKHFSERYYQGDPLKVEKAASEGANVINIHHNTRLNPFINYPFIVRDPLKEYIREQHEKGRRVKLYYTIRELSNHAAELYALRSLGTEIFPDGPGGGAPWLWEHLNAGYKAAWYAPSHDQTADESIVMNGFSRWINYYIEGLRWMVQQYQIDGLYLDDVAYDRDVIMRLRRVLLRYNPNALLDLHSNTNYSIGPANQYTAFFPYLDRLWFGESFKYNTMSPDQWLVQFSGIPFGLMSEMLEGGGNKWLGMVYGATVRHSWGAESPAAIWKYWDVFGIQDARMLGYWDKHCPVSSNNNAVKITVYEKKDKLLLSVGNFSDSVQYVTPQFMFEKLPFRSNNISIKAPAITGFQESAVFEEGKPIRVAPKKGWLLEVTNSNAGK